MDEQTLSIILECPVCLNILTESSRVLPCQHTFCYGCLEDIIAKRGNLHCPECRAVVSTSIDGLPRNILLVRLLEGIRVVDRRRNSRYDSSSLIENSTIGFLSQPAKSCPSSPGFASSNFPFFFSQTKRKSLPFDNDTESSNELLVAANSTQYLIPRSPTEAPQRTSNMGFSNSMDDASTASSRASYGLGMRTSRTTTDLAAAVSQLEPFSEGSSSSGRSVEDRYFHVPTLSFIESPATTVTVAPSGFSQEAWRSSPRNRSFPSGRALAGHSAAARTTSSPVRQTPRGGQAWNLHKFDREEPAHTDTAAPVTQTVHVSVGSAVSRNQPANNNESPKSVSPPKEVQSFIKHFFRGHKKQASKPDLLEHKLGNISITESSGAQRPSVMDDKAKKPCLNTLRSNYRHNKPMTFECYRCVTPYLARNHYELDLHLNDLLYVHQKHSDGWMKATHERTGRNGLIPVAFVERLHGTVGSA